MTIEDDTPRCGREDAIPPAFSVVRCSLPKGHEGVHMFIYTWRDRRDEARI
jgi:hypothetical protein